VNENLAFHRRVEFDHLDDLLSPQLDGVPPEAFARRSPSAIALSLPRLIEGCDPSLHLWGQPWNPEFSNSALNPFTSGRPSKRHPDSAPVGSSVLSPRSSVGARMSSSVSLEDSSRHCHIRSRRK